MKKITSLQNPKIKEVVRLYKTSKNKGQELIVIEGLAELTLALESGIKIKSLFYCPALAKKKDLLAKVNKNLVYELSIGVFKKISYRENPDGYIAIAQRPKTSLQKIKLSKNPLVMVLETMEKPGNLGAILRSADAAGADAVICCDLRTDIFNPNVIRSSLGTVFTNQIAVCTNAEALAWLKENKIISLAASVQAQKFYTNVNLQQGIAIVIGAEHEGLSNFWQKNADEKIKIPMKGKIDSLNASVSAAIILYEVVRQRME